MLAALGIPEVVWVADARRALAPPPLERLADALASQRLLLVLDNCEHVIDAVARLAARVLADAPGVRILATSREPLGVTGETLCPVPSLPLPPAGAGAAEATRYAAIRLFRDRAAAVRPGFTVDEDTVAPVIAICTALDGIPLAIELAAARLRSLTLTQVESRLNDRFRLLGTGPRATPDRHQTLRAIVDWSWDLLGGAERAVLRRLSVFRGGATPDAAEPDLRPPGTGPGAASDIGDVIDVIASLVDKSLVTATGNTDVRYRLLETVRVYADERLTEAGEKQQVQAAHAAYFLAMAEDAEPRLRTAEQLLWLDRLNADHDNFSAALRYALDRRDGELGLRLVASLMWYWVMLDFDAEGGNWAREIRAARRPGPAARPVRPVRDQRVRRGRRGSHRPRFRVPRPGRGRAAAPGPGAIHRPPDSGLVPPGPGAGPGPVRHVQRGPGRGALRHGGTDPAPRPLGSRGRAGHGRSPGHE